MNSSGPNMDPWGTPQVTFMETVEVFLYDTNCFYHLNNVWTNLVTRLLYRNDIFYPIVWYGLSYQNSYTVIYFVNFFLICCPPNPLMPETLSSSS